MDDAGAAIFGTQGAGGGLTQLRSFHRASGLECKAHTCVAILVLAFQAIASRRLCAERGLRGAAGTLSRGGWP
eukprot:1351024-Lingulodinium_polyedra.AAC.1